MGLFNWLFGESIWQPEYAAQVLRECLAPSPTFDPGADERKARQMRKASETKMVCSCGHTCLVKEAVRRDATRFWLACPACAKMLGVIGKLDKPDHR